MIYIARKSLNFVKDTILFIYFVSKSIYYKNFFNLKSLKKDSTGNLIVLANGPSLKDAMNQLVIDNNFKNSDFVVMNYFAFDEVFFKIKPKYYCLGDPGFSSASLEEKRVLELYKTLESRVDWNLSIYVPSAIYKKFRQYSKITNKNITIIKINVTEYCGYERLRFFFYKKNMACPPLRSIVILAILVGINKGYLDIHLYGVDHTYFDSLCVDSNNRLCTKLAHFYDGEDIVECKPIIDKLTGKQVRISDYLNMTRSMFVAHDVLADYARYMGVKIVNCTKNSLIDSYERYT